jgi:hypothetical protein
MRSRTTPPLSSSAKPWRTWKDYLTHLYPEARGHEGEMVRDLKANLKTNMPVELGNDLQSITL